MNKQNHQDQLELSREKYIQKIIPIIRKKGFNSLKMDDIAKYMDISKATLYKYFSSKDEIIERVVEVYVRYIQNVDEMILNESLSFDQRFQKVFEQSVLIAIYISDIFLDDLKTFYPRLFDNISQAQADRNANLKRFFDEGIAKKAFHPIHSQLFMLQDDVVLRKIIDPVYLIQMDLTLKQALYEYYTLKKFQLFQPETLSQTDDDSIQSKISYIAHKISMEL